MKKVNFLSLVLTLLMTVISFSAVSAQETNGETEIGDKTARPFRIMQELGLSREQIQQIRRIHQQRKPIVQEAQQRWQTARRDLDMAIYGDDANEEQIKELTVAAQRAQADLLKERTITEYLIRKVLTPEQLTKFRQLRQQLMERVREQKANRQENRDNQQSRPLNRFPRRMQNRQQ